MDHHPIILGVNQSNILAFEAAQATGLNDLSEIWQAAQDLVHPDVSIRRAGFAALTQQKAARLSPLAAYLLTTRISEPDLSLRVQIVQEIASTFTADVDGVLPSEEVRSYLGSALAQMRKRQVYALLQAADFDPQCYSQVARVISKCCYAGNHLADILAERRFPPTLRRLAARLIGDVGYLEAKPALERYAARLGSRQNGNGYVDLNGQPLNDNSLLPEIEAALEKLR